MSGTDWGYACEPFAPELLASPRNRSGKDGKARFPNSIQLTMPPADGSGVVTGEDLSSFFTIRAPSWKGLLRAMAWYGNTLISAGPQEVADAALAAESSPRDKDAGQLRLAVEIEFVTPSRLQDASYAPSLLASEDGDHGRAAHVSLCLSLVTPARTRRGSEACLAAALKRSSRSLDTMYLRRGSARRVITLPRQAPSLPVDMVKLAQHVHAAHRFSAACPTTSSTALHSPRDLHHAVEAHDISYVQRIRAERSEANRRAGRKDTLGPGAEAGEVRLFADGQDEDDEPGRARRITAAVKRRFQKRAGDGRIVDDQLIGWITPLMPEETVQHDDAWEERR
jgi:hypothetical protein